MADMSRNEFDASLESFAELERDWNSYGAAPIDPRAVEAARTFRDRLRPVPTCRGGTQIEVHWGGFDFEVEFNPDGSILGMLIGRGDRCHAISDDED